MRVCVSAWARTPASAPARAYGGILFFLKKCLLGPMLRFSYGDQTLKRNYLYIYMDYLNIYMPTHFFVRTQADDFYGHIVHILIWTILLQSLTIVG